LSDSEFEELKKEFVEKLNKMAINSPNTLITHEHLHSLLYRWKRWGDEEIVTSWLKSQLETSSTCLSLLKAFVSTGSSQGLNDYLATITRSIKLENIEEFLKIEDIQNALNNVELTTLDYENQDAVRAFEEAIERREKTLKDEG